MTPNAVQPGPLLLYDGSCGFCNWTVQLVLRNEKRRDLFFAKLESPLARRILEQRPELAGIDSVVWVELDAGGRPSRAEVCSTAVLEIARYLGGWWSCLRVLRIVPRALRDRAYALVARHRRSLLRQDRCVVPTLEQRQRFLDGPESGPAAAQ